MATGSAPAPVHRSRRRRGDRPVDGAGTDDPAADDPRPAAGGRRRGGAPASSRPGEHRQARHAIPTREPRFGLPGRPSCWHEGGGVRPVRRPGVLRLVEIERPAPGPARCWSRSARSGSTPPTGRPCRPRPAYSRIGGPSDRPYRRSGPTSPASWPRSPGRDPVRARDRVFGDNLERKGGFAEYAVAREKVLAAIPTDCPSWTPPRSASASSPCRGCATAGRSGPGSGCWSTGRAAAPGRSPSGWPVGRAEVTGVDRGDKLDFVGRSAPTTWSTTPATTHPRRPVRRGARSGRLPRGLAYRRALAPGGRYRFVGGSVPTLLRVLVLGD